MNSGAIKLLVGFWGIAAMMTQNAVAQNPSDILKAPSIQVTGVGRVSAAPDMAEIRVGVTTEDADIEKAVASNIAAARQMIAELAKSGIAARDVQTSNFSVYPQARSSTSSSLSSEKTFRVSNSVAITVREIDKLGAILGRVVGAGANQIERLSFSFADPEPLLKQARERAVADARVRAETYAASAGVKLGKITLIVEQPEAAPLPVLRARAVRMSDKASVPIEAGEGTVEAQIVAVWELAGRE